MSWGWLKKLGGWLFKYAPSLIEVAMDAKAAKDKADAAKAGKPPSA